MNLSTNLKTVDKFSEICRQIRNLSTNSQSVDKSGDESVDKFRTADIPSTKSVDKLNLLTICRQICQQAPKSVDRFLRISDLENLSTKSVDKFVDEICRQNLSTNENIEQQQNLPTNLLTNLSTDF